MKNVFFYIILIAFCFTSCKKEAQAQKQTVTTKKITFKHEGNLKFLDSTSSVIKEIAIEIAKNNFERETGLMYRKEMKKDRGMIFIFDDLRRRSFYMKNTYIPLDIIFIDENNVIINIAKGEPLNDSSLLSDRAAKYVLEVNQGMTEQWGIKPGDKIEFSALN